MEEDAANTTQEGDERDRNLNESLVYTINQIQQQHQQEEEQ